MMPDDEKEGGFASIMDSIDAGLDLLEDKIEKAPWAAKEKGIDEKLSPERHESRLGATCSVCGDSTIQTGSARKAADLVCFCGKLITVCRTCFTARKFLNHLAVCPSVPR